MARIFRYSYGFNFIEILMTLALVAILVTYGLPIYTKHVIKSRRFEAANNLTKLALAMEKFKVERGSYQGATLANLNFPELIADDKYHLIIQYANNQDYLLIANPLGQQADQDPQCGALTLNASGEKGATGSGKAIDCW